MTIEIRSFEASSPEISLEIPALSIQRGSFCALVAKSGAGKSVLFSVLTGHLLGPWMRNRKAIRFDLFRIGKTKLTPETFAYPTKLRSALKNENLIYLPQKFPDDRSMTRCCLSEMADVVEAVASKCSRKIAKQKLTENCQKFNLDNILNQPLKNLSGGERKRVEIIARLTGVELQDKDERQGEVIFLLDEPTTGLDNATQRQYFLFLKQVKKLLQGIEITFITATHALSLLEDTINGEPIFDDVLYVEKTQKSQCKLTYCGDIGHFLQSKFFLALNGKPTTQNSVSPTEPVHPSNISHSPINPKQTSPQPHTQFRWRLETFDEELRRANGKQFEGKSKRSAFIIPFLVGLFVFAAFLARTETNHERFIFFSTIYAFWIGLFNSCQIVNGAISSGEWNYWVLALRRSFLGYIMANALVAFVLSLLQAAVFAITILLFSYIWGKDSLFNVFVTQSQLPIFFIETVAGIPINAIILTLFFTSLFMGSLSGVGIGTLISCITKDTIGALKVAVGVVVIAMITSTTVLKSDMQAQPVSPPLYLKLYTSSAPFFSSPSALSNTASNAGFFPHFLEDASFVFPQRYFFNIGRILGKDVLETVESYQKVNPIFEYKLTTGDFAENWKIWKRVTNEETLNNLLQELQSNNSTLHEKLFLSTMLKIVVLEILACTLLSLLFLSAGILIAINRNRNYEIH